MNICSRKGHTKASYGAVGILDEYVEDRKVGNRVIELLRNQGHNVIDCTPSDSSGYGEWNIGVNICNNSNAEIFFSIHFNAGGGMGSECIKHSTDNSIVPYANGVLRNLTNLGFRNRGIKNNDELAETSNIKVPSMIVEVCFVDTENDANLYRSLGVEKIARAIANGIDSNIPLSGGQQNNNIQEEIKKEEYIMKNVIAFSNEIDEVFARALGKCLNWHVIDARISMDWSLVKGKIVAVGADNPKKGQPGEFGFSGYTTDYVKGVDRQDTLAKVIEFSKNNK